MEPQTVFAVIVVLLVMLGPHIWARLPKAWRAAAEVEPQHEVSAAIPDPLLADPDVGLAQAVFRAFVDAAPQDKVRAMQGVVAQVPGGIDPALCIARGIVKAGGSLAIMQREYPNGIGYSTRAIMSPDPENLVSDHEICSAFLAFLTITGLTVPGM